MSFLALESTGNLMVTFVAFAASVVSSLAVRRLFGYSFSTWRFHLRGEAIRSAVDIGWMHSLTVGRMMNREFSTVPLGSSVATVRGQFALGSTQRLIALDEQGRYAGMLLVQDLYAVEPDVSVSELLHQQTDVLLPDMVVKEAIALFEKTETDALAVVDNPENMLPVGLLTEQFALRQYSEQLDRQRRVLSGE